MIERLRRKFTIIIIINMEKSAIMIISTAIPTQKKRKMIMGMTTVMETVMDMATGILMDTEVMMVMITKI